MLKDTGIKRNLHSDGEESAEEILDELCSDPEVQKMKQYRQHGRVTTYEHCRSVARASERINRSLHLHADTRTLLTGAMLHDFYLYDWHEADGGSHDWHGFIHAGTARQNAVSRLGVKEKVAHVIESHMWPLNLTRIPKSREAWIVCVADKYVSLKETLFRR